MDEMGPEFSDRLHEHLPERLNETPTAATGATPSPAAELRKRRSTRIVQAVPLAVTGVDAIGRTFTEHTSSLIINCHGCRYQSKHYVLKNMWVKLEVPHPEAGHPRAWCAAVSPGFNAPAPFVNSFKSRWNWKLAGNIWGIAFPPEDWFAFPETAAAPQNQQVGAPTINSQPRRKPKPSPANTNPSPFIPTTFALFLPRPALPTHRCNSPGKSPA